MVALPHLCELVCRRGKCNDLEMLCQQRLGDIDFMGHGTAPPARFLSIFEKRPGSHGEATRQRTLAAENARKNPGTQPSTSSYKSNCSPKYRSTYTSQKSTIDSPFVVAEQLAFKALPRPFHFINSTLARFFSHRLCVSAFTARTCGLSRICLNHQKIMMLSRKVWQPSWRCHWKETWTMVRKWFQS